MRKNKFQPQAKDKGHLQRPTVFKFFYFLLHLGAYEIAKSISLQSKRFGLVVLPATFVEYLQRLFLRNFLDRLLCLEDSKLKIKRS